MSDTDPKVIQTELNHCLKVVFKWFATNKLTLNVNKSKVMYFGTKRQLDMCTDLIIRHRGKELEKVDSYKYLGVVLDSQLSFSDHVTHIRNKTVAKIRVLGGVRGFMDQSTAHMLYKTLVQPLFDYNDYIFENLSYRDQYSLQKLQNTCFRNVLKTGWMTPSSQMHSELKQLKLSDRRFFHTCCEMYKAVNLETPPIIAHKFQRVCDIHDRHTRTVSLNALYQPKVKLELCKNNFTYRGVMNWSSLPQYIKNAGNMACFKDLLMTKLLSENNA